MKKINFKSSDLSETFGDNINAAIQHTKSFIGEFPKGPTKPKLIGDTSSSHRHFAEILEIYEGEKILYEAEIENIKQHKNIINNILEEYVKNQSGLNTIVPVEFRTKVYHKAYQDGHSSGFHGIYNELIDLVNLFEI